MFRRKYPNGRPVEKGNNLNKIRSKNARKLAAYLKNQWQQLQLIPNMKRRDVGLPVSGFRPESPVSGSYLWCATDRIKSPAEEKLLPEFKIHRKNAPLSYFDK